mmetsp:Transcript_6400/g.25871  ORF Transcript_6400/g.25871 Transcript_6400/m.25871 type:complete len:222 (-) Transcript_6400:8422-9087(-)
MVDHASKLGHLVPLVQLAGTLHPAVLPKADLGLLHGLLEVAVVYLRQAVAEDVLCASVHAVLHECQPRRRLLGIAALAPEACDHVVLAQEAIQIRERVEAARVLREEVDVALQHRDGHVPSVVRSAYEADQLARHLGLGERERDAFQKRLHHVRPLLRLPEMAFLGEERDHRLHDLHLVLLVERCPGYREEDDPQRARQLRVRVGDFLERLDQVLNAQRAE